MKPFDSKSDAMKVALNAIFPDVLKNISDGCCPTCGEAIDFPSEFKDELSKKEYLISGMCQKCQDEVFG